MDFASGRFILVIAMGSLRTAHLFAAFWETVFRFEIGVVRLYYEINRSMGVRLRKNKGMSNLYC